MARDLKYGKIDIPGIGEDEPVFIIRGNDALAPRVIGDYRRTAVRAFSDVKREDSDFLSGVEAAHDAFIEFQLQNPENVKLPD